MYDPRVERAGGDSVTVATLWGIIAIGNLSRNRRWRDKGGLFAMTLLAALAAWARGGEGAARPLVSVVAPRALGPGATHGLGKLLETIDLVARRVNHRLRLTGVVFCMYDAQTRLAIEVSEDVDEFFRAAGAGRTPWAGAQAFRTRIRRNIRLAEAPSFGQSIFQYAPDSNGARDYRQLAQEIRTGSTDVPTADDTAAETDADAPTIP